MEEIKIKKTRIKKEKIPKEKKEKKIRPKRSKEEDIIAHRKDSMNWKRKNMDKHLDHMKKYYILKKIKFEFLNILLEN